MKFARGRALFSAFIVSVLFGALFFIIWQAIQLVMAKEMTSGDLIAFVSYTAIMGGAIAGLGNFYTQLLGAIGATEKRHNFVHQVGSCVLTPSRMRSPSPVPHGDCVNSFVHIQLNSLVLKRVCARSL